MRSPFCFGEGERRMRFTIDNLDGAGERDYTALLDSEAPARIVRKLNQVPVLTVQLAGGSGAITASAGSKARLYRDSGDLWFSGYLSQAPLLSFAGESMGQPVFRISLVAKGELSALDRAALSQRSLGGRTAGQGVAMLTEEANAAFDVSGVQDIAQAGACTVETGELWSKAAGGLADCARATLSAENLRLAMVPVGSVTRTLNDTDAGFEPASLSIRAGGTTANDITVIGTTEPTTYVRDCFTATGTELTFKLSQLPYKLKAAVAVEDDFHAQALDTTKWVSDVTAPLTFTSAGVACAGQVALRYRDRLEMGGLYILEQTGISYGSGSGIVGGLYVGGFGVSNCIAGIMINGGQVSTLVNGVAGTAVKQMSPSMLYEFRTLIFHPEPIRAGQSYASSLCNGSNARTSQVWFGNTQVVLTMREIDPTNASTTSVAQTVLFDGILLNVPAYADYLPLWGQSLTCTLGHASATNEGAVWVRSAAPGQAWRTRLIGDVTAGAECYLTSTPELHFTAASEPVSNEQLEVFYRARGLACARVTAPQSIQALQNSEGQGTRAAVLRVGAPVPRTSLDCEQAACALLDDMTQAPVEGEYTCWATELPAGAGDVQPGELWNINAPSQALNCAVVVHEVEVEFQGVPDNLGRFKLGLANDAAQAIAIATEKMKHNGLLTVVSSALQDNVASRPSGLPDARVSIWGTPSLTVDAGTNPVPGGGIEVRVEGDWGWGMQSGQNLVGRFSSRTFTLPNTGVTQTFYLRQFDASTPPNYSTYSTVLNLEV